MAAVDLTKAFDLADHTQAMSKVIGIVQSLSSTKSCDISWNSSKAQRITFPQLGYYVWMSTGNKLNDCANPAHFRHKDADELFI